MIIEISNLQTQNLIFFLLFFVVVLLTFRKKKDNSIFPAELTNELKGLAILSIIFAHVTYGLVSDNHFLWPLGNIAGVGVDLFLFLSGFGLTLSTIKKPLSPWQFYLKRLSKVLLPVWIFLIIFLILDKFALNLTYPINTTIKNFLGFFARADLYNDINSPLWFITPLIFYYLLFPIIFKRKYPEITAIIFFLITYFLIKYDALEVYLNIKTDLGVKSLWALHYLAFPVGIIFASFLNRLKNNQQFNNLTIKIRNQKILFYILYSIFLILLLGTWYFFYQHSGVGQDKTKEQIISNLIMLITVFIFMLKPFENKFLIWSGIFSFEIYLLHWPIMYRYDFLFKFLPAGVAMFLYLLVFIGIGWVIKNYLPKITFFLSNKKLPS